VNQFAYRLVTRMMLSSNSREGLEMDTLATSVPRRAVTALRTISDIESAFEAS
jgi:hypothetical protein